MSGLLHHAAREMPKAIPGVVVVATSGFWSLPWQPVSYFLGCVLILTQLGYTVAKWRREARAKVIPTPTVPPSRGA